MSFFVSFELTIMLGERAVLVVVHDHYIQDGDLDENDNLTHDQIVFNYRVFDIEEDAEILQLSDEDKQTIHKALLADLQSICAGGGDG